MSVFDEIIKSRSLSVIGMAKNTGKTECMKHILSGCARRNWQIGITSIGIDGESLDQVTGTPKPEIVLSAGNLFVTTENFFRTRKLSAEVLAISEQKTALGRWIVARAITPGKVILAGPTATATLCQTMAELRQHGADTILVDGALSRKSLASPAVTDTLILTTGAALSPNLPELVRKTHFTYNLINLPAFQSRFTQTLSELNSGIWAVSETEGVVNLQIPSAFLLEQNKSKLFQHGHTLYVNGAVGNQLFNFLRAQPQIAETTLVVRDFTRIFADPMAVYGYLQKGGKINLLHTAKLLCVCANPWSPNGYTLDSVRLCNTLSNTLGIEVYDIKRQPFL